VPADNAAVLSKLDKVDARLLAEQITLIEHKLFHNIQRHGIFSKQVTVQKSLGSHISAIIELLGQAWTKKDKLTRAPNLIRKISSFNQLSSK
jgi:hypothetical protein